MAGGTGKVGCFSFFPSKNLGAFGDGGLITTNDDALVAALRRMRVHGAERQYFHQVIGGNFRLDALQAAILRVKLRHLDRWSEKRAKNAALYNQLFEGSKVGRPNHDARTRHIYNQYVLRAPDRDGLRAHLTERGIGTEIYYPVPLHLQKCFASLGHKAGDMPHAEAAARETLALPIYPELTEDQIRYVASSVREYVDG
jgi:dTDP-4-amino-4,6-dideoxygalactose transaminase